ncbi:MAG: globin family protein [Candidatus Binatia bacterium]
MTPTQKVLVQTTWAKVEPIAETAAKLFYGRLFELDPSLQPMFRSDMTEQGKKLMAMLAIAVRGLDRLDELAPALDGLGPRHIDYGVADSHYDTVGAALLWTLEQGLGADFTPELKDAWATVYGVLASSMRAGATAAASARS